MTDREKVIKALEICSQDVFGRMCINCTYESDYHRHCHEILMGDALELLKEQESEIRKLALLCTNVDIEALLGRKVV